MKVRESKRGLYQKSSKKKANIKIYDIIVIAMSSIYHMKIYHGRKLYQKHPDEKAAERI